MIYIMIKAVMITIIDDVKGTDAWKRAAVVANGNDLAVDVPLPPGRWHQFADATRASTSALATVESGPMKLPPHSAIIIGEPRS